MTDLLSLLNRFENAAGVYERSDAKSDRDELHAARRAIMERDAEAERYAERLATVLWEKHWKADSPQWKPLSGDMIGILTQIDNMTAGLTRSERDAELLKALRGLLDCPYIAEGDQNDPEWGCSETAEAEAAARAALRTVTP